MRLLALAGVASTVLAGILAWELVGKTEDTKPTVEATARVGVPTAVHDDKSGAIQTETETSDDPRLEPRAAFTGNANASSSSSSNAIRTTLAQIEAAVDANDTPALAWLTKRNLDSDPETTSVTIRAVGHLAASARRDDKDAAARTLGRWLREETGKEGTFARGNVSLLTDALADCGSTEAVAPLVSALDASTLPLHAETRMVEALAALGDPRSANAIERFAARVDGLPIPSDDTFAAELHHEAQVAARQAVARLREPREAP